MLAAYPEAPVFVLGDFNTCRHSDVLPSFHQYVNVATRKENILDLCYGNITSAQQLQGSLACTDWDIFQGTLDERVNTVTEYIHFCIHTTIPTRTIKNYPNSKPWITPHIKHSLKEKRKAFKNKDWATLKTINRQIKNDIIRAKMEYKNKLEQEFTNMNTKQAFQKIKKLTKHRSPSFL